MSLPKTGLGRGLDALFENNNITQKENVAIGDIADVNIDLLVANPNQPRKYFDEQSLKELADSIASQGIVQPLLVRKIPHSGKYEIIAGERRFRAALLVNLKKIPVFIRDMTDTEVMAASLIENIQRENLNPIEEAIAYKQLLDEFMITQDELAKRIGKSRPTIANSLRLLNLTEQAQKSLILGKINVGHARSLLSIDDLIVQESLLMSIMSRGLTVRDAENAVKDWKNGRPFFWLNKVEDTETDETNKTDETDETGETDVTANNEEMQDKSIVEPETANVAENFTETENSFIQDQADLNEPKSENIKELQRQLNEQLNLRANISGTAEKGIITLSYQNETEFNELLEKLGIQNDAV